MKVAYRQYNGECIALEMDFSDQGGFVSSGYSVIGQFTSPDVFARRVGLYGRNISNRGVSLDCLHEFTVSDSRILNVRYDIEITKLFDVYGIRLRDWSVPNFSERNFKFSQVNVIKANIPIRGIGEKILSRFADEADEIDSI